MKKLTLFYLLLAFFWTITSCSEKTALEQSLDSAGENRTELEAVLNPQVSDLDFMPFERML